MRQNELATKVSRVDPQPSQPILGLVVVPDVVGLVLSVVAAVVVSVVVGELVRVVVSDVVAVVVQVSLRSQVDPNSELWFVPNLA